MVKKPKEETVEVLFNRPIVQEVNPIPSASSSSEQGHSIRQPNNTHRRDISPAEIRQAVNQCYKEGLDERAIVTLRGFNAEWKTKRVQYWGIVAHLYKYKGYNEEYIPLRVLWTDGSVSRHWPEELFVIHPAVSDDYINGVIDAQQGDINEPC